MNSARKTVNKTEEQRQKEENERYMQGRPSRMEVANYVNALLEDKYMPEITKLLTANLNASRMGLMVLQAILIDKGVCTGEEIETATKTFIEHQKAEAEKMMKEAAEKVTDEAMAAPPSETE